ncbi:MAG TPA: UDP-N-acetylglucosamine 1-carboxyvinyltransferase [Kofleriaceae bacterium]|nr:UDP-N-acetylglucosamine 1-carboxyvinyltransferase [Kofleriaceae bacterium]
MDKIVIEGGARLRGEVKVSGAKNAALPLLASSLLASGASTFKNVPNLNDVVTMRKLLAKLGCEVDHEARTMIIAPPSVAASKRRSFEAPYDLVKTMRASVLVLGPLVARYGRARVSLPGGCAIGARPIDQHLKGLEAMGATVSLSHGYVECEARRLRGARIVLDIPTVTGCENLMMAAALARGMTIIENAAREPEVEELAQALVKMGARIEGAGTPIIQVEGVDELQPIEHTILPDRIEAGTFLVAAAITRGDVLVRNARADHLDAVIAKLRSAGVHVAAEGDGLRVRHSGDLRPIDITTQPYPGFPTDMQAQLMVLCAVARGQSVIKEAIFENRFMHVSELSRMGADIQVDGRVAVIRGVPRLGGAQVMATDLRASASLVLAGLVARGETEVLRVYHLDRGYERIEKKLRALGAQVKRVRA